MVRRASSVVVLLGLWGGCAGTGDAVRPDTVTADAEDFATQMVVVEAGPEVRRVPRTALGVSVHPLARTVGFPPGLLVDPAASHRFASELAVEVNRPPLDGEIDLESRRVTPSQDGLHLDVEEAQGALLRALESGADRVELPVTVTAPEIFVPEGLSLETVVGEWTTRFRRSGSYRGRARNVRTAAASLHGAVIPARGQLSFNDRVGERTRGAGYRPAPVISQGELVDGMGGGVCQVSSTLYAAAFFAGLDFTEHSAHSRPSSYIRAGLDATVSWPDTDLVIDNPFDFPLYVEAAIERNRLTVRLLGSEKPRSVELTRRQGRWRDFDERVEGDEDLVAGTVEVSQEGIRGRTIFRRRIITEDERRWTEDDEVVYPPTDRIVRIGLRPPEPHELLAIETPEGGD